MKRSRLSIEALEGRDLLHGSPVFDPAPEFFYPQAEFSSDTQSFTQIPIAEIPALNSYPEAPITLYLNFIGRYDEWWGTYSPLATPAFSQDSDPLTFSPSELTTIQNIWAYVSEDYAPFNVNVTTVAPPTLADGVAVEVAIGGNGSWVGHTAGGVAYVGGFHYFSPNVAFVFSSNLGNSMRNVAEATSHEAGHLFGLYHQSLYDANGNVIQEYYTGTGAKAPIMGNSYSSVRGLWWNGLYQDDLARLSDPEVGIGLRPDDHGDFANPTLLTTLTPTASGIISEMGDNDYFQFTTGPGIVEFTTSIVLGNNLDVTLEIRDASDSLVLSNSPSGFSASISTSLAQGTYYLVVKSHGNYGDLGQYTLTGTTVPLPSTVLARHLFYNNSHYDTVSDDAAIATDKVAYVPGSLSTFDNLSSYSKGINGIILDITGPRPAIEATDFMFKVGNSNDPTTWVLAPTPVSIVLRPGEGVSGSDRIVLIWEDGVIRNKWLQITVNPNVNTGLVTPDVFYFGNSVGDSGQGNSPTFSMVNSTDELAARNNPASLFQNIPISNRFDYNRDGRVNSSDGLIPRNNPSNAGNVVKFIQVSVPAMPASENSDSLVASTWSFLREKLLTRWWES